MCKFKTNNRHQKFRCIDIIQVFNSCFLHSHNTKLVGGGEEPLYLPADKNCPAQIIFTRDYFASALHEVSHWCLAGVKRLQLEDYGYWYVPDGRNEQQQRLFETVEIKPQAQEWIFSEACGYRFGVSVDNLNTGAGASPDFKKNIVAQARLYCAQGLGLRANQFAEALAEFYGVTNYCHPEQYRLNRL